MNTGFAWEGYALSNSPAGERYGSTGSPHGQPGFPANTRQRTPARRTGEQGHALLDRWPVSVITLQQMGFVKMWRELY